LAAQIGFEDPAATVMTEVQFTPSERVRRRVFEGLQPLIVEDVPAEPHLSPAHLLDLQSALVVPIEVGGQRLGAMQVGTQRMRRRRFTADEGELALAMANQAAVAIENARLFEAERQRQREAALLAEMAKLISGTLDLDEVLRLTAEYAVDVFEVQYCFILLKIGRKGTLRPAAQTGFDDPLAATIASVEFTPSDELRRRVFEDLQPLIVEDVPSEPHLSPHDLLDMQSALVVPIEVGGRRLGAMQLGTQRQRRRRFTVDEGELALAMANQAAMAIQNARLFDAEQRRAEQFRVISEVGRRTTSILAVDELLDQIVGLIQEVFNYYLVEIGLVEGDELVFRARAGRDRRSRFESFRLKAGKEGVTGWVVTAGEPLLVPDVSQEPRYIKVTDTKTRSELAVPIKVKEKVTGVINIESDYLDAFDESDVAVLQSLAHQAAIAIENARHFEAEQRRAEQFKVISEVGRQMTSILAVDELLVQMATVIQEAFNYHQVGFGLIEGDEVVAKAGAGPLWDHLQVQPARLKVGEEGIVGWVAATGQPLLVPDVSQEPRFYFLPQASETKSELAVPLRTKDAVIGALDVQSDLPNAFDEYDLVVLQSLANQAAIAIENARLYEQAQQVATLEERQRLARELHDSVTQALYGVTLYAEAAARLLSAGEVGLAADHLRELGDTAQEALREMRLLIFELRPPVLEEEGLLAALQARLEAVEGRAGLATAFKVEGVGRLAPKIEEGLYRIAQEALNNALKHAQAHSVTMHLCYVQHQRSVTLEIVDDGIGFDPDAARGQGGLGLAGMEERAARLGGWLMVKSSPGDGTSVKVEVYQ
jgi:GAF domain-containing protein